eukprot:PhM_4_TR3735/c0_g1_i1/m.14981
MSWQQLYVQNCQENGVAPRPELDTDDDSQLENVSLPGNTPNNFGNKLVDEDVAALCIPLSTTSVVSTLDLSFNKIGDHGAIALAEALRSNSSLIALNLSFNDIGALGARALADAAMLNLTLLSLILRGNDIEDEGANALGMMLRGNNSLQVLDVARTGCSTKSLVCILQAVSNHPALVELHIDRPLLPGVHDVACVVSHLTLCLSKNSVLRHIGMGYMPFCDEDVQALLPAWVQNTSLQSVLLRGNRLSALGGLHIAKLLARRHDISLVDLEGNRIDNDGAVNIANAIRHCTSLETLLLASNNIGEKGLTAIADSVPLCPSLQTLTLWGNRWGPVAAQRYHKLPVGRTSVMNLDFTTQVVDGVVHVVLK